MADVEHVTILKQGKQAWNDWRDLHPLPQSFAKDFAADRFVELGLLEPEPEQSDTEIYQPPDLTFEYLPSADLSGFNLDGVWLGGANLRGANLDNASLYLADLSSAELSRARLGGAILYKAKLKNSNLRNAYLVNARLDFSDLSGADLTGADLSETALHSANLQGANLSGANLSGADLSNANLSEANAYKADFSGADLSQVDLSGAHLGIANLGSANVAHVHWDRRRMRGHYLGIRGIDSCFGNALFRRAAADQDFLDTLEWEWHGTWRMWLFRVWSWLDFKRSMARVGAFGFGVALCYGLVYAVWRGILNYHDSADTWFTPFYFSIVTFTTLGFGDVKPRGVVGEVLASSEVVIGYITLGLLLAVLAEKLARRS